VERSIRATVEQALIQRMGLAREYGRLGLTEIHADCTAFDYGPIIGDSMRLIVVLNDGRTWASVHRDRLRKRFSDGNKETVFIVVHPDSAMVEVLARKGCKEINVIGGRIRETVQLLEEIKNDDTKLEVLGHYLFNPHAIVIGDDAAVITPFFHSRGGRTVPAFKYQDVGQGCYFRELVKDVELLRIDAKDIRSSSRNSALPEIVSIRPKSDLKTASSFGSETLSG
jgi:hypothetical protein